MKSLRNASSLILTAPGVFNGSNPLSESISVFLLKRSSTTSHFPEAYVFPGGNCDAADQALEWLSILPSETLNVPLNIIGQKPQFDLVNVLDQLLPEAISLRITAIRETFEESGILLCKQKHSETSLKVSHFKVSNANLWREKIRQNAHEFITLCRTYECFPNISNLYFLSTWITPIHISRRYSCKFFIAIMDQQVDGEADKKEIETAEWYSKSYLLENAYLPPPQIYELSMLTRFPSIDVLCEYAHNVNSRECLPYMPASVCTIDGIVIILPGDENYEQLDNLRSPNTIQLDSTAEEYRGKTMHRIELINGKCSLIIQNCSPRHLDFINLLLSKKSKI